MFNSCLGVTKDYSIKEYARFYGLSDIVSIYESENSPNSLNHSDCKWLKSLL